MGALRRKKKQVSQDSLQNSQTQVAENRMELNPAIVSAAKNDSHEVINAPTTEPVPEPTAQEVTPASAAPVRSYAVSGEARGSVYAQPGPANTQGGTPQAQVTAPTSPEVLPQGEPIQAKAVQEVNPAKSYLDKSAQERFRAAAQGNDYIAQILLENQERIEEAEAEDKAEAELDHKRAAWTGAGELAAGLVNLFGVGRLGATHQKYHSYSRDWQERAERNAKERRSRIDNLKARQDSIKMQRQQLLERRLSEMRAEALQAQYREEQAEERQAEREANAQWRADQLEQNDKQLEANIEHQKNSLAETSRHNKAMEDNSRDKAKVEAGIKLARYGLKEDESGKVVIDNDSIIAKSAASGGKATGRGKNKLYYTDDDGDLAPVYMTATEYKAALDQVYALYSGDKEFRRAYMSAPDDSSRRSVLWSYAIQTPEIRAQLKMYEDESYKPTDKPTTVASTSVEDAAAAAGIQPRTSTEEVGMEVYDKYK